MLRKVSCWPAKEASGRSSAVAEERTAKDMSAVESATRRWYCSVIATVNAIGNGVSMIALTDLGATGGQRIHVLDIERIEHGVDLRIQTALRQKVAISLGRGGKAAGHANAGTGQLADHFAQ